MYKNKNHLAKASEDIVRIQGRPGNATRYKRMQTSSAISIESTACRVALILAFVDIHDDHQSSCSHTGPPAINILHKYFTPQKFISTISITTSSLLSSKLTQIFLLQLQSIPPRCPTPMDPPVTTAQIIRSRYMTVTLVEFYLWAIAAKRTWPVVVCTVRSTNNIAVYT